MGVGTLEPVITRRTQVAPRQSRPHAGQCPSRRPSNAACIARARAGGRSGPCCRSSIGWDAATRLVFCDEAADVADPLAALRAMPRGPARRARSARKAASTRPSAWPSLAVPQVTRIALGPAHPAGRHGRGGGAGAGAGGRGRLARLAHRGGSAAHASAHLSCRNPVSMVRAVLQERPHGTRRHDLTPIASRDELVAWIAKGCKPRCGVPHRHGAREVPFPRRRPLARRL